MVINYATTKKAMKQAWDKAGKRLAITVVKAEPVVVVQVKSQEKDGYQAVKVGIGTQKSTRLAKSQVAYYEKLKLKSMPRSTKELKPAADAAFEVGSTIKHSFMVGDIVNAQGITKGRGFAGAIKRWGFHGGPKTHGQSDRHRAVGSIGQGTDPGRVHRGKKMPGHYGVFTKTVKNLLVVHVDEQSHEIWLSGPVPGSINGQVILTKTGHKDAFTGLKENSSKSVKLEENNTSVESVDQPAEVIKDEK